MDYSAYLDAGGRRSTARPDIRWAGPRALPAARVGDTAWARWALDRERASVRSEDRDGRGQSADAPPLVSPLGCLARATAPYSPLLLYNGHAARYLYTNAHAWLSGAFQYAAQHTLGAVATWPASPSYTRPASPRQPRLHASNPLPLQSQMRPSKSLIESAIAACISMQDRP